MKASWRKMTGTAFLWVALAALMTTASTQRPEISALLPVIGFLAFALGLALFSDGLKREIVAEIRNTRDPI